MSVNLQFSQYTGPTKGFLYKVKNGQDQTVGYIWGTCHQIPVCFLSRMHDKISRCLQKCQRVFVELYLNEEALAEYFQRGSDYITQEESRKLAKKALKEVCENPRGAEDFILSKAHTLGLQVGGLETEESREKAKLAVAEAVRFLKEKKRLAAADAITDVKKYLQAACQTATTNPADSIDDIIKGCKSMIKAIDYIDFSVPFDCLRGERTPEGHIWWDAIKLYDKYVSFLKTIEADPELEIMEMELIKMMLIEKQKAFGESMQILTLRWLKGDATLYEAKMTAKNPIDAELQELEYKELHLRDLPMAEVVHNDLLQATPQNRSFHTVGYNHLDNKYESLKKILQKKGWTIINAYT
jgi:uncharacterized protein YbaP (TraB family)